MGGGGQGREFFREIQSSELAKVHGGEGEMQRGLQRTGVPLDFRRCGVGASRGAVTLRARGAVTGETGAERWQACSSLVLVNVVRAEEGQCLL